MQSSRLLLRSFRAAGPISRHNARFLATTAPRCKPEHKDRLHPQVDEYRKTQTERADNPHLTNTNSTITNEMPSVGKDTPPPEFISQVDGDFVPKDSVPENTERMTGGTQPGAPKDGPNAELGVGEIEGIEFKVKPIKREGEDTSTMRARLLCPS